MDKKHLVIVQAVQLPVEERKAVCKAILESIERDQIAANAKERFDQLVPLAEMAMECTYVHNRKKATDTYVRYAVTYQMRKECYTYEKIGKAMDRDASSVISMMLRAEDMKNGFFGTDVQKKFNTFINLVEQ